MRNSKKIYFNPLKAATLLALFTLSGHSVAASSELPTNGKVVVGTGSISQSGSVMTINQNTDLMAINWKTFNVGADSTVNFVQPNSYSVALNRVLGSDVSVIQGKINANGYVALVNPNGILFTPTAQVNVGGLIASTLNISNKNFINGNYIISGTSSNAVINQGNITALDGGTVMLIAAKVKNEGTIVANKGNVSFAAGSKVTLDFGGPVKVQVNKSAVDALIENGGAVEANGGVVYFTASAANTITTTVINNTGIIEAKTLSTGEKGEIYLLGDKINDRIVVGGKLDVSAPKGGDKGTINIDAAFIEYITASSKSSSTATINIETDAQKDAQTDAQRGFFSRQLASSNTGIKIQSIEDAPTAAGGDEDSAEAQKTNEIVINYLGDGINLPD